MSHDHSNCPIVGLCEKTNIQEDTFKMIKYFLTNYQNIIQLNTPEIVTLAMALHTFITS